MCVKCTDLQRANSIKRRLRTTFSCVRHLALGILGLCRTLIPRRQEKSFSRASTWDQLKVFVGKTKQKLPISQLPKLTDKSNTNKTKTPNLNQNKLQQKIPITMNFEKNPSLSQTIHNNNIDCIGCYGHADRSTSLSYLENVNNLNKAEVICRNLGTDKDLWVLKSWILNCLCSRRAGRWDNF